MDTMYAGKINSPSTTLNGAIDDSVTTINVVDGSVFPDAPNIAVIGTGEDAETILYGAKAGNELSSITRGFQGTAKAWAGGEYISRLFTAYDYDSLRNNIGELNTSKLEDITDESLLDLKDTPAAFNNGKFAKSGAAAITFESITESDITDLGNYLENVVEDTTPQLGGDLDMNEKNIVMDSTLTADHSYSGITDVVTVGESVVFGDVLYFKSDGEWYKANAAGTGTYPGLVIALESKTDGQACKVLRMGYIRDDSWSWTVGAILLLGETAGALTATVPSDSGDMVQRLGYAIHADKIYFMPSIDVGEI